MTKNQAREVFKYATQADRAAIADKLGIKLDDGKLFLSPQSLLRLAAMHTGQSADGIMADAISVHCQKLLTIALANREQGAINSKGTTQGIKGGADERMKRFYYEYRSQHGTTPTVSMLAKKCQTNFNTAKRWVDNLDQCPF